MSHDLISHTDLLDSPPAGIIFDLDGTLLDTEPLYSEAAQMVIEPYGHRYSMELKKRCMGGDSRRTAKLTIEEYDLPMDIDEYLSRREAFLLKLFEQANEIQGAGAFINELSGLPIPMGLATSSHQNLCDVKLQNKPWRSRFQALICGDHQDLKHSKPAPDIFLICAAAMAIPAETCIAFEDSPTGIKAARAAGMRVVAVNSQYVELADLSEAEVIIDDYEQLMPILKSWH